jgi:hypothetical protein
MGDLTRCLRFLYKFTSSSLQEDLICIAVTDLGGLFKAPSLAISQ